MHPRLIGWVAKLVWCGVVYDGLGLLDAAVGVCVCGCVGGAYAVAGADRVEYGRGAAACGGQVLYGQGLGGEQPRGGAGRVHQTGTARLRCGLRSACRPPVLILTPDLDAHDIYKSPRLLKIIIALFSLCLSLSLTRSVCWSVPPCISFCGKTGEACLELLNTVFVGSQTVISVVALQVRQKIAEKAESERALQR